MTRLNPKTPSSGMILGGKWLRVETMAAAAPSFVFQPHCDLQEIMGISVLIDVSIIKFGSGRGRQQMTSSGGDSSSFICSSFPAWCH